MRGMYEREIQEVLDAYRRLYGFDLSYMRFRVDPQPVHVDGSPCYELDPDECGGDCTRLGWIRLNPDMRSVMRRYGVDGDVQEFTRAIIAHELAHELWNSVVSEDFKRDVLDRAERENFSTVYLKTVRPSKLREETFCEWMANAVTRGGGKSGFYKIDARDNVVADCGDPIGKIGLSFYDDIKALGIGSFEIFPEYRRRGHGEAVLRKLVGEYRNKYDLIYCFVDADNAPALALYSKIGRVSDRPNDKGQYMVTFWKRPEKPEFRQAPDGGSAPKAIDFPEGEVESLRGRDVIVTHRVSDDFYKFHKGDAVRTPWGDEYEVVGRDEIGDVSDSPYAEELTPGQYRFLSGYGTIAVLTLRRKKARNGLEFRQVLDRGGELKAILREMPSYADNSRLDMSQFEKYLADDGAFATLWYGCFDGGRCTALAVLKKYRDDGVILLAEVQSAVRGYGGPLMEDILSRSRNIWWCADPDGGESLVRYYRRFGVNEYLIRKSKWVGGRPETAFYKAEDPYAERRILATLRAADMESPDYRPDRISAGSVSRQNSPA